MKLNIAICDDEQNQIQYVKGIVSEWAEANGHMPFFAEFPSAEAFLFDYAENQNYDILLLDIEMTNMNGIDLAKKVREENDRVQIVFITGYPDFMSEGFEVAALHYLMKPVKKEKLFTVLDRAVENMKKGPRFVLFSLGKETLRVYAEDIRYAESDGHYILLHADEETHRLRMTIPETEKILGEGFFRAGRSFIVGLKYVARITKTEIILLDGTVLPIGKGLYDDLNKALIAYLRGI